MNVEAAFPEAARAVRREVFVFDIDGTLCFDGRTIDARVLAALERLAEAHHLVFASARHPVNIAEVVPEALFARAAILGANGAIGLARGRVRFAARMPPGVAASVRDTLERHACPYLAYGSDFVVLGACPHPRYEAVAADCGPRLRRGGADDLGDVVKFLAMPPPHDDGALRAVARRGDVAIHRHRDGSFDVSALGTDKRNGLERLGLALPVFAAFGNDLNDLGILAACRHAVAVGDCPEVCAVAGAVIETGPDVVDALCARLAALADAAVSGAPPDQK